MALTVHHDDARLRWHGAVSLERDATGTAAWRIPVGEKGLFPEPLLERAKMTAGVRVAFRSNTTRVAGTIQHAAELAQIDLCLDGELIATQPIAGEETFAFENLPAGEKRVALWLPQKSPFRLRSLELSDGATLEPLEASGPRWITYGSSITHCGGAASPAQTWPAIVARARDLDLTCLGFGGQCHLDPMIARLMRDLPADIISICVGINIYGGGSLGPRAFRPAVIGTVKTIREKHPDAPLALMSPIFSPPRETTPNAVGFTLQAMRDEVAAAVAALRDYGDRNIHYVNGLDIFGPDLADLLPDNLHPNADGYRALARNFGAKVMDALLLPRG